MNLNKLQKYVLMMACLFASMQIQAQFLSDASAIKGALEDGMYAVFETPKGVIVTTLEFEKVPLTVANFIGLAEGSRKNDVRAKGKPFYDGNKFHRVIDDFMIQGGDPANSGGGKLGYSFKDEFHPELNHNRAGTLSMANAGPATNNCQFFITHKDTKWLNDKHSVFGYVVAGQQVVNEIKQDDKMISVRIIRKGKAAEKFNAEKVFEKMK